MDLTKLQAHYLLLGHIVAHEKSTCFYSHLLAETLRFLDATKMINHASFNEEGRRKNVMEHMLCSFMVKSHVRILMESVTSRRIRGRKKRPKMAK